MAYRCKQCGWKYPTFHICLDLSKPSEAEKRAKKQYASQPQNSLQALAAGRDKRWAKYREEMKERDKRLVQAYREENKGLKQLADEFDIAYQTARGIVHRAVARGEVILRPRGHNARYNRAKKDTKSEG